MDLTITNIIRHEDTKKAFGFAVDADGQEFFIPRGMIIIHDLTDDDIGLQFSAVVRQNPNAKDGSVTLSHVTKMEYDE